MNNSCFKSNSILSYWELGTGRLVCFTDNQMEIAAYPKICKLNIFFFGNYLISLLLELLIIIHSKTIIHYCYTQG